MAKTEENVHVYGCSSSVVVLS